MTKTYFVKDLDNGSQPYKIEAESAQEAKQIWLDMEGNEEYQTNNLNITGDGFDAANE